MQDLSEGHNFLFLLSVSRIYFLEFFFNYSFYDGTKCQVIENNENGC